MPRMGRQRRATPRDMASDPFYGWLEVHENWTKVAMLSWAAFFAAGFLTATLAGGTTPDAIRFGSSLLVWGCRGQDGGGVAPDVVGQFSDPFVGLSQLRDTRQQPQQCDHRGAQQRRRLA